jgi:alpha-D-xyloside xylohydrolase
MKRSVLAFLVVGLSSFTMAQTSPLERNGQTITIEPYAPNVVRVTLSLIPKEATAGP